MARKDETGKPTRVYGRKPKLVDRTIFLHRPREPSCLYKPGSKYIKVKHINFYEIKKCLAHSKTIEHQIIALRGMTQLTQEDFINRLTFTRQILNCLEKHHQIFYEGIIFGSSVNGLGFRDSDVDLRIRPLRYFTDTNKYEPISIGEDVVHSTLRNIAYQTANCCPAIGEFVPSSRVPIARLLFMTGQNDTYSRDIHKHQQGLKYDISMSLTNCLGSFNSKFLRFLCNLEPKFHLLATVIRYWSVVHKLIVPGLLSSYALINMLIFFCQSVQPPLLPTVDQMQYREIKRRGKPNNSLNPKEGNIDQAILRLEWLCTVCMERERYNRSSNDDPISVLLLKFFEFYLNFPYSTNIITIRPGRALTHEEFVTGTQYHPLFPIKVFLNIQDPFDLKHNLTSGMSAQHFRRMIDVMKSSYEILFQELLNNFSNPISERKILANGLQKTNDVKNRVMISEEWGLINLFKRVK